MSITVIVTRAIGAANAQFTAQAEDSGAALTLANILAGESTPPGEIKKADKKPEAAKEATKPADKKPDAVKAEEAKPEEAKSGALTYDGDVKPIVLEVSKKKGRETIVALLSRYGIDTGAGKKASDLKPEQWADFISDAERVLAGTYDPMAADADAEIA